MHQPASPIPAGQTDLDARVERGLRWSAIRQIITGITGTLGAIAYARMLQPEDLGAFGLAMLVYSALFLLIEAPIRDAVVYYQDESEAHDSAAFWLLIAFSAFAILLVFLLADLIAQFYQSPQAAGLTRVLSVAFLFRALAVVPAAQLLKRFNFALHEGLYTIFSLILFIGWVILAAIGYGAWSLVIPVLLASVFWAFAVGFAVRFRPVLHPDRATYRDVYQYSRSLFGSKLITYLNGYIDNAAAGTLGKNALGWYSLGEDQSAFAVIGIGSTIATIALPVLARARERLEEFKRIYIEMLRLAATLSTPIQIGTIVLADLGVQVIFGEQWMGAVPVLRAYLAFRLIQTLVVIGNAATSAIGRPDLQFKFELAQLPFFIAGTWFGLLVWGGISGLAWSLALVRSVAGLIYLVVTFRITHLSRDEVFRHLMPSSLAGLLMGLAVYLLPASGTIQEVKDRIEVSFLSEVLSLLILVLFGAILYFIHLFILDPGGFRTVAQMGWQILLPAGLRTRLKTFRAKIARPRI